NVVKLSEYEDEIYDITADGTHVLLWISACNGNGLDSFSSSEHHNNLESWSFRPKHEGNPSNGKLRDGGSTYQYFCWLYGDYPSFHAASECAYFKQIMIGVQTLRCIFNQLGGLISSI
ncbi:MAG: hypothetical protein ACTSQX_12885, partial [Candidatus Heimdallarchaeota archaeon]